MSPEIISALLSFLFTIMILSYIVGDNPLFRIGMHIFVGVSAGYIASVAIWQVIVPRLIMPFAAALSGKDFLTAGLLVIPLILSVLALTKMSPQLTRLGNASIAFLVGAGAATAVAGAVLGTIFPQTIATINLFDLGNDSAAWIEKLIEGLVIILGVITSLAYFHFSAKPDSYGSVSRNTFMKVIAVMGQVFIAMTFGVLFAGIFSAALTALVERIQSILQFFASLI
jgi:hypothetical protein